MQGRAEELLRACADGDGDAGNDTAGGGRRMKSEEGRRARESDGPAGGSVVAGGGSGGRMGKSGKGDSPAVGGSGVMARLAPHQPVPTLATYRLDGSATARGGPTAPTSGRGSAGRRGPRNAGAHSAR